MKKTTKPQTTTTKVANGMILCGILGSALCGPYGAVVAVVVGGMFAGAFVLGLVRAICQAK